MIQYLSDGTPFVSFGYENGDNGPIAYSGGGGNALSTIYRNGGGVQDRIAQLGRGSAGGAYDSIYTGHTTERVPENPQLNALLPYLTQRFGTANPQPSYSFVNGVLKTNGKTFEAPLPDGVSEWSAMRDEPSTQEFQANWARKTAAENAPAPLSATDRSTALLDFMRQRGSNAMEAAQAHLGVFGSDPLTMQDRAAKQMAAAVEMLLKKQQMEKGQIGLLDDDLKAVDNQFGVPALQAFSHWNPTTQMVELPAVTVDKGMGPEEKIAARAIPYTQEGINRIQQILESRLGPDSIRSVEQLNAIIAQKERARRPGVGDLRQMEGYTMPPWQMQQERLRRAYQQQGARFDGVNFDTAY